MSWKKHFRAIGSVGQPQMPAQDNNTHSGGASGKYSSYLPEVYAGHPNRIQRYYQYDDMDRDSDISVALNTIADFCTQSEEQYDEPFSIKFEDANETEVKIINACLTKWTKLNDFRSRLWYIFRNVIKNGDAFFLRDPETGEWLWIDHFNMLMVKVDEEKGKEPDEYVVKGLDYSKKAKFATNQVDTSQYSAPLGATQAFQNKIGTGQSSGSGNFQMAGAHVDPRSRPGQGNLVNEIHVVDAKHVVHLSLSIGMDINWPFGQSILEPIYKTYKQKELLEDAILIYRVQRAPERRIFYIDVGQLQGPRAKAALLAVKNEIHQRRIPNKSGGGSSIVDAAYSPLSMMDDYFLATSAEGRNSRVETLPGGDNLGEIGDLDFFTKKLARGLNIPSSYLALSDEQSGVGYNDGKLGSAIIQEFRFNKYCMRIQSLLAPVFDKEFKDYVSQSGVNVENNTFELQFCPPQNFTKYRQIEIDQSQLNVYQSVAENKKLSERFKLRRFLNLTEDEIVENERLWKEENASKIKSAGSATTAPAGGSETGLSDIGIRPGDGLDDFGTNPDGTEGEPLPDGSAPPAPGGAGAAPAGGSPLGGPAAGGPPPA